MTKYSQLACADFCVTEQWHPSVWVGEFGGGGGSMRGGGVGGLLVF